MDHFQIQRRYLIMEQIYPVSHQQLEEYFHSVCESMTDSTRADAEIRYQKKTHIVSDEADLSAIWEPYHLRNYIYHLESVYGSQRLYTVLGAARVNIKKRSDLHRFTEGNKIRKRSESYIKLFMALAEASSQEVLECFYYFLKFCFDKQLPLAVFDDDASKLEKVLKAHEPYIKALANNKKGSAQSSTDSISIFWLPPNNSHEQPQCRIEFGCDGDELVIPNTYENINLEQPSTVLRWSANLTEFQGREQELELLHTWLDSSERKSTFLITGDGGAGKTRLAFHFAEEATAMRVW